MRRLHALREQRSDIFTGAELAERAPVARPAPAARPTSANPRDLMALVPGTEVENERGICFVSQAAYPVETDRGGHPLADLLARPTQSLTDPANFDFRRAAFIDTETTGLGGSGVYAFMVGVGTFEGGLGIGDWGLGGPNPQSPIPNPQSHFVVRQFFMRSPAEEPALLTAVAELLADRESLVTFNGRTFDVPLLRGRFSQNRRWLSAAAQEVPLLQNGAAHLDLLHPARRLWRRRLQSVRLINLEEQILGLGRAESDVPGSLIPYLYIQYLQSGDATEMGRIFYHNREDIVSMVPLAERLCRIFDDPFAPGHRTEIHGLDMLSLGHTYESAGKLAEAEAAFRHADTDLTAAGDLAGLADLFNRLGTLLKRQERWAEAVELWERWISTIPGLDPTPYVELAKVYEWREPDLDKAAMWTGWALHTLRSAPIRQRNPGAIAELEHRLARIQLKIEN
ncbi:MAG: ribonuclease H-like domain-containing protein [Caldilineaceae bacterium]|nr:ribonuclease H-like domain-containing protein [Caldilineaceae bacterium]